MGIISEDMKPALQGVFPALLVTSSLDGAPNSAVISQVYYVDPEHVALSFQFFNKTIRNIRENPNAFVLIMNPQTGDHWELEIVYEKSQTEGPIFDAMDMQLEAIASAQGLSGVFKLKAADIYKVKTARKRTEERAVPPKK